MKYLGNLVEDQITDFKFSTHKADGTPITLAGTPAVSVYKGNGTTETTTGVTLTVDFDARTGMHHVMIDTSADAFYAVANDYAVVITAGTVDSISVVGTVLAIFSIENRFKECDVVSIAAGALNDAAFNADTAKYQAKVWLIDDSANDRYAVVWFKNGEPIVAGITSPDLWVFSTAGVDLVATSASPQAMSQIGSSGTYKYDEGTNRVANGSLYLARVRATIDGSTRTWYQQIGRDA